jgi:hypothetical protein
MLEGVELMGLLVADNIDQAASALADAVDDFVIENPPGH